MKIFIAAPCYDAKYCGNFVEGIMGLQMLCKEQGVGFIWPKLHYESLITRARDRTVQWFLTSDADVYVSIDTDIGFDPKDILRLARLGLDCVAGPYPIKASPTEPMRFVCGEPLSGPDENGLIEIPHAGTGFLMFSRRAIRALVNEVRDQPYKVGSSALDWLYPVFKTPIKNDVLLSEDWHVCYEWRRLGGKVLLDPSVKLSHAGGYTWQGQGYILPP